MQRAGGLKNFCPGRAFHVSVISLSESFAAPWAVARQAPLSMGFSRQEHWSELPRPPPGDVPDPGIGRTSLASPALADGLFTSSAAWEAGDVSRPVALWAVDGCEFKKPC